MFAIRRRMHRHAELAVPCHVYAEMRVSNCTHLCPVTTVKQTFRTCGVSVTNDAKGDIDTQFLWWSGTLQYIPTQMAKPGVISVGVEDV